MILLALMFACSDKDDSGSSETNPLDTDTQVGAENEPPSAPVVALSPEHPADGDDLALALLTESVDPEGTAVTYRYVWRVNGAERADLTGTSVGNTETAEGDVWEVEVIPSDGELDGPGGTASVTVGNLPPTAPTIHLDPAAPVPRDDLNLVYDTEAVDPEGDALTTTIRWYENDIYYPTRDGLVTLDGIYVDGGDTFRVEVSVTDGTHDPVTASASVSLPNTPPTIKGVRISPTSALDDDELVVTASADDPDGGYVSFRYVWFRDGVEATDVGDTDTVSGDITLPGEHWTVVAYGSDGHDEVSAPADQEAIVIPWEGTSQRHIFTMSLTPNDAGGYDPVAGQWAVDYLAYDATSGNHSCELLWAIEATENSRYCRDCAFSFESNFTYDPASQVDFGCTDALEDGSGYFFFNEVYGQFNAYNTGPAFDSRSSQISLRITPDSDVYSITSSSLTIQTSRTSATYDDYGNVELYMYFYATDRSY